MRFGRTLCRHESFGARTTSVWLENDRSIFRTCLVWCQTRHWEEFEQQVQDDKTHTLFDLVKVPEDRWVDQGNVPGEQRSLIRKRSNLTMTQVFTELSLGFRRQALSERNWTTRNQLSALWRLRPEGKTQVTNCWTHSFREDDEFNKPERSWTSGSRRRRKMIVCPTTKRSLQRRDERLPVWRQRSKPNWPGGEHEERVLGCRTVACRSEGGPGQRERSGTPRNSQPFTKQRSSMVSQSASTVEVELPNVLRQSACCGLRQAFVVLRRG